MLHFETVYPATLGLLKELMALPELSKFNLVGGTALALQIGHRISVDLDLFGQSGPLQADSIRKTLAELGEVEDLHESRSILTVKVNGIKVDLVNYQYDLLKDITVTDSIRMVSKQDIAAMKLGAIAGRGRKRDFIDLYFLMQHFTLREILGFYQQKYPDGNPFLILKSLTYFEDAEEESDLNLLIKVDWGKVKSIIEKETNQLG